jgi:hypothetical protein
MLYIYLFYIAANIADFLSTISYGLYNWQIEENPTAAWMWMNGGVCGLLVYKALTTALFLVIYHMTITDFPRTKYILSAFVLAMAILTFMIAGTNLGIVDYNYTQWLVY